MSTPEQVIEETKAKQADPAGRLDILWNAVKAVVMGTDLRQARHDFDPEGFAPAPMLEADVAAMDAQIAALEARLAMAQRAKTIADLEAKVAEAEGGSATAPVPEVADSAMGEATPEVTS